MFKLAAAAVTAFLYPAGTVQSRRGFREDWHKFIFLWLHTSAHFLFDGSSSYNDQTPQPQCKMKFLREY